MENANPPLTLDPPALPTVLHVKVVQELDELQEISAYIDSRLENIKHFLNGFLNPPNKINMDDLESDNESVDTPFVSPFLDLDDDSDDGEVLNELEEYGNAGKLRREKIIYIIDGDDLTFPCMIGFRKFVAYFNPFLPMNIITRKAYNTIMVEGLKSTGKNLVAIVKDVYVFVKCFTYVTDFIVLEDIGEFIVSDMA
nr:protein kinase-like domain, concanavalin A-like lectin/glucanase domain protein [Tanacetum cinerariifolium]